MTSTTINIACKACKAPAIAHRDISERFLRTQECDCGKVGFVMSDDSTPDEREQEEALYAQ